MIEIGVLLLIFVPGASRDIEERMYAEERSKVNPRDRRTVLRR